MERILLGYNFNDLEPYIDSETMRVHYDVLYKKYTDNLNEIIKKYKLNVYDVNSLVKELRNSNTLWMDSENNTKFVNNAGGYLNHRIYFDNLTPELNTFSNAGENIKLIINGFGGYDKFKEEFKQAGLNVFGSGWVWLTMDNNSVYIMATEKQYNPLMAKDVKILLAMDVWEHSYFLKHQADRAAYIDDFFKVIDWNIVNSRA
jgi:Fe-Mn family superoxide dismutase